MKKSKLWVKLGLISLFALVMILPICIYRSVFDGDKSQSTEVWGQFGDYYGGILNPILSFFAFMGLIYTIHLQRKQLDLSHEELKLTRAELEKSALALQTQSDTLKKQNFDSTFFQLISLLRQTVEGLKSQNNQISGVSVIESLVKSYESTIHTEDIKNNIKLVVASYENQTKRGGDKLGHYLRLLYNILKMVDESELSNSDKTKYVNLIRAQLSNHELLLIFYNGISQFGNLEFKPLIEKYGFLKSITHSKLTSRFKEFYSSSAYK